MRRLVLTIAVLASTLFSVMPDAQAQRRIYHNVGDTIDNFDTIYWTEDWLRPFMNDSSEAFYYYKPPLPPLSGMTLMKCYTSTPIQVIGLASSFFPNNTPRGGSPYTWSYTENWPISETREQEYMLLYKAYPDTILPLLSLPINLSDPYRILKVTQHIPVGCEPPDHLFSYYYRIYESYIDKAITVTDSFYVGTTLYSCRAEGALSDSSNYLDYVGMGGYGRDGCTMDLKLYRRINRYNLNTGYGFFPAGTTFWMKDPCYIYTFPILLIDTTFANPGTEPYVCPNVDNFRAAVTWETGGTLLWDVHARHRKWQIRVCPEGSSYDNYIQDTIVNVPYYTAEDLQSHTRYSAFIRAVCEHYGDTLYGEWSDGIDLYTVVDIASDDVSNEFVRLMPNPASDMVQVFSSFALEQVSVYNLNGMKVYDVGNPSGVSATIDVSGFAIGTYIVVIRNQQGVCTKKLVVR